MRFGKHAIRQRELIPQKELTFAICSLAIALDMLVYSLVIPVIPSYALRLGADTVTIGIIFGSFSISLLIFSIPFGIISDRIGRQPFMVLGMLSLAATNAIFAVSGNFYVLIIARLLQGMSGAATWSAGLAMIADTFEPDERAVRLGAAMSFMSVGALLGPAAGGLLYDNFGYATTFIVPSVMACAVGLASLMIKEPAGLRVQIPFKEHISPLLKAPGLFVAIALAVVAGAATYGILEPYMPVYLLRSFSATPTIVGLTFGSMSFLSIVAQPVVGKLYNAYGPNKLISAGLVCSAFVITGSVLMPSLRTTAIIFSLLGATLGFALTPMLPLLSDLYGGKGDSNSKGLVYGVYNTLFSLGLAIGPLFGGLLIASYTFRDTVIGYSFILVLVGFAAFTVIRRTVTA
jgi:multidrug resistance protein